MSKVRTAEHWYQVSAIRAQLLILRKRKKLFLCLSDIFGVINIRMMAYWHCGTRIQVPIQIRISNMTATLYYGENAHTVETWIRISIWT